MQRGRTGLIGPQRALQGTGALEDFLVTSAFPFFDACEWAAAPCQGALPSPRPRPVSLYCPDARAAEGQEPLVCNVGGRMVRRGAEGEIGGPFGSRGIPSLSLGGEGGPGLRTL